LIAAGLACICSAVALGEEDLVRAGVLLLVLPLAATAVLAGTRLRLRCVRSLEPRRVSAGALVRVTMQIENASRTPTPAMFAEDLVLPGGGGPSTDGWTSSPRFALDRLEGGEFRTLNYTLRPPRRGSYDVGPLAVRLCDPFGFCELPRMFHAVDRLLVTPEVVSLPGADPTGRWSAGATGHSGGTSGSGEDDLGTRPYRPGDELRRVHWRTTARVGELSVRREEQPRQGSVTLILDTRASAWPPGPSAQGAPGGVGDDFETAVSVVASVAAMLAARGIGLRLVTLDGALLGRVPGGRWTSSAEVAALFELLADVRVGAGSSPQSAGRSGPGDAPARETGSLTVAVLGRMRPADAEVLPHAPRGAGLALLVGGLTDPSALAAVGWRAQPVPRLSALPTAWGLLVAGSAPVPRGSMS
jgi:uncharacterized protein (DUF58 family)